VENGSRQLPGNIRNAIYNHLAACLPCGKETLIKRAKKLCMDQHDEKLKEPISRLKEGMFHIYVSNRNIY
jgi:ubinuclein